MAGHLGLGRVPPFPKAKPPPPPINWSSSKQLFSHFTQLLHAAKPHALSARPPS
uniref:Uncharacterized protein n=1 Tax=Oryza brachyantha TaxID=4533 RepID=J3L0X2_ORYBR